MKTISIFIIWMAFTTCLRGQGNGYYYFSNLNSDAGVNINAPVFNANGQPLRGSEYIALLYAGTTPTSLTPTFTAASIGTVAYRSFSGPGYISPEIVRADNVLGNTLSWVQVRVWDYNLGATYEEVAARNIGGYGESSIFSLKAGYSESIIQPAPLVGLESFSIRAVVPEPGTVGLLAVGAAILIGFRNCGSRSSEQGPG